MSNALGTLFGEIADAIREKSGESGTMKPAEFPAKIAAIPTGGGSAAGAVTVTFCNYDGTELYSRQVFIGDDCPDPVTQGKISTPTKESTAQYYYTHNGWSTTEGGSASATALKNITADKTVYAAYSSAIRKYTVRFYDGDTLMKTESVAYGSKATPPNTIKDGFSFTGWTPSDLTIYADTDFFGAWEVDAGWLVRKDFPNDIGVVATQYVRAIYSVDGSRFFVANATRLYMYDATVQPYSLIKQENLTGNVTDIAVSPNGNLLAVSSDKRDGYIKNHLDLYYLFSDDTLAKLQFQSNFSTGRSENPQSLAFSADSSRLYVSYRYNTITEIDTAVDLQNIGTARPCKSVTLGSVRVSGTMSLRCSPDGQKLAVGTNYGYSLKNIYIHNIVDGDLVFEDQANNINQNGIMAKCMDYSPDGKYLAVGGMMFDSFGDIYEIIVYDTTTAPYTRVFTKNLSYDVNGVTFSHDGTLLAFAVNGGNNIEIYDVGTWAKRDDPMEKPNGKGVSVAFNDDDTMLAVGVNSSDHVYLYEVRR